MPSDVSAEIHRMRNRSQANNSVRRRSFSARGSLVNTNTRERKDLQCDSLEVCADSCQWAMSALRSHASVGMSIYGGHMESEQSIWQRAEKYKSLLNQLNSDSNLHFIIRESDLEKVIEHQEPPSVEMVFKKSALYARRAIILTEPKTQLSPVGDYNEKAKVQWTKKGISAKLRSVYENYYEVPAFKDSFFLIPERLTAEYEIWDNDEFYPDKPDIPFDFSTIYANPYGVHMSFGDPNLNAHIFETLQCKAGEVSVFNVWLPQLANIPLDILLKLRDDENEAFRRFHYSLKQLITGFERLDAEAKVKELFQCVDHEVRQFETTMGQIRKARYLKAYELLLGYGILGLCFALPSEISKIISSALGIFSSKEFITHLFREREQIHNLKASEFYVPWLCTKLD